jgi:hypothetical protein
MRIFYNRFKLIFLVYCFILYPYKTSFAQAYSFQNGITLAGGLSSTTHLDKDFKKITEKDISEALGFSWEIGYLNTKSLNEKVAFTYGLSVMSLRNTFKTGPYKYTRKDGSKEEFNFNTSQQRLDRYLVGISFKWSFFLNKGPGRFYVGPGFSFSAPVFNVSDISGSTLVSDSISFKDKYFTETGPYLFIPVEANIGYQREFNDCSLLRIEAFSFFRADGIIMKTDPRHLEKCFGLRLAFFFSQ